MAPRHGLGYERIEKNAIKCGIPSVVPDDTDLIAFRFAGNAPMVGYRKERTFFILWLDRDFTLYDHE